ncbi:UNVERIFIED_CONTAM: hypothetical protein FKN15_070297 [Acipenser sinensis]
MCEQKDLVFESFLKKRKDRMKLTWSTYWFRLQNTTLFFYTKKKVDASHLRGQYYIHTVQSVREVKADRQYLFEITMKNGKKKLLSAETEELRALWMKFLWKAMQLPGPGRTQSACTWRREAVHYQGSDQRSRGEGQREAVHYQGSDQRSRGEGQREAVHYQGSDQGSGGERLSINKGVTRDQGERGRERQSIIKGVTRDHGERGRERRSIIKGVTRDQGERGRERRSIIKGVTRDHGERGRERRSIIKGVTRDHGKRGRERRSIIKGVTRDQGERGRERRSIIKGVTRDHGKKGRERQSIIKGVTRDQGERGRERRSIIKGVIRNHGKRGRERRSIIKGVTRDHGERGRERRSIIKGVTRDQGWKGEIHFHGLRGRWWAEEDRLSTELEQLDVYDFPLSNKAVDDEDRSTANRMDTESIYDVPKSLLEHSTEESSSTSTPHSEAQANDPLCDEDGIYDIPASLSSRLTSHQLFTGFHCSQSIACSVPVQHALRVLCFLFVQSCACLSGYISTERFRSLLNTHGSELDPHKLAVLLALADSNADGRICYQDFVNLVAVFVYYGLLLDRWVLQVSHPLYLRNPLVYHPQLRAQAWRYLSYIFMHAGIEHLSLNVLLQLLVGVPLEMVHGALRIGFLYISGVLAGSLAVSVADMTAPVVGSSGGVYALVSAHLANIVMNWSGMKCHFKLLRMGAALLCMSAEFGRAVWLRFYPSVYPPCPNPSFVAHLGGVAVGVTLGVVVLRNYEQRLQEQSLWWIFILVYIVFVLFAVFWNIFAYSLLELRLPPLP